MEKADSAEAPESPGMQEEEFLGDKYYDKTKCFFDNISSDLKPRYRFLRPRSSVRVCAALNFVVDHQENLGRGEEAEHGNIWRPRTFPEGKRIQSQRPRRVEHR